MNHLIKDKMVKEEIVEGLKYAVAKGESLPKAMMSFYNAGYLKKDVEEAARALQVPQLPQTQPQQPLQQQIQPQQIPQTPVKVVQKVSAYGERPKSAGKALILMLVFFLILLLGVLVAVFLFRDELSELLGNIL
ncbi:unnamed protein product [marine sediment metagenome]|uniref:Uncharacterized protein n=1 Tax=marine sediment metagenome TaxID=412755 RepID=X1HW81_9ZZZZ